MVDEIMQSLRLRKSIDRTVSGKVLTGDLELMSNEVGKSPTLSAKNLQKSCRILSCFFELQ